MLKVLEDDTIRLLLLPAEDPGVHVKIPGLLGRVVGTVDVNVPVGLGDWEPERLVV